MARRFRLLGCMWIGLALACNPLAIAPGEVPTVTITWPLQVINGPHSDPTDVYFEVENCHGFTAQVEHRGRDKLAATGPWYTDDVRWHASDLQVTAGDQRRSYVARLPRSALVREDGPACLSEDANPYAGELRLKVDCGKAALTAVSNPILVYFTASERSLHAPETYGIKALDEPGHFVATERDRIAVWHPEAPTQIRTLPQAHGRGEWAIEDVLGHTGLLAARDFHGYLAVHCTSLDCGTFALHHAMTTDVASLYSLDLARQPSGRIGHYPSHALAVTSVAVPSNPQAIAVDQDGSAVVFSAPWASSRVVVTRVRGTQATVEHMCKKGAVVVDVSTRPRDDGDIIALLWYLNKDHVTVTLERLSLPHARKAFAFRRGMDSARRVIAPLCGCSLVLDVALNHRQRSPAARARKVVRRPEGGAHHAELGQIWSISSENPA